MRTAAPRSASSPGAGCTITSAADDRSSGAQQVALGLRRFGRILIDMPAHDALGMGLLGFEILEREFQLIGKLHHAFGRLAELHAGAAWQAGL